MNEQYIKFMAYVLAEYIRSGKVDQDDYWAVCAIAKGNVKAADEYIKELFE